MVKDIDRPAIGAVGLVPGAEGGPTTDRARIACGGSKTDSLSALVQSDQALATDVVTLYKALGGGWEDQEHVHIPVQTCPLLNQ